jgi:hypothetical protein
MLYRLSRLVKHYKTYVIFAVVFSTLYLKARALDRGNLSVIVHKRYCGDNCVPVESH